MADERMTVIVELELIDKTWLAETPGTDWFGRGRTPEEAVTSLFHSATEIVVTDNPELLARRRKGSALKFWSHCLAAVAGEIASSQMKLSAMLHSSRSGVLKDVIELMCRQHELQNEYDRLSLALQREALLPEVTQVYIETAQAAGQ